MTQGVDVKRFPVAKDGTIWAPKRIMIARKHKYTKKFINSLKTCLMINLGGSRDTSI